MWDCLLSAAGYNHPLALTTILRGFEAEVCTGQMPFLSPKHQSSEGRMVSQNEHWAMLKGWLKRAPGNNMRCVFKGWFHFSYNEHCSSQLLFLSAGDRHSGSWHHLSETLCLQLRKVPLPAPLLRHIWKLNCSLLHMRWPNIFCHWRLQFERSTFVTAYKCFDIDMLKGSLLLHWATVSNVKGLITLSHK